MHQITSIIRLHHKLTVQDPESEILQWENDFNNYIRNVDAETQEQNLQQIIEKDAIAYGISLTNLFYLDKEGIDWSLSIPEKAYEIGNEQSKNYYQSKPELKNYIDDLKQKIASDNRKNKTNHPPKKRKKKKKRK